MIFDIVISFCMASAIVAIAFLLKRQDTLIGRIASLALKVNDLENYIDRVDKSLGTEMNRLGKEFAEFRELYGDAAVEELRESAKREKAWANGINAIMSYGAHFQGRGDTE